MRARWGWWLVAVVWVALAGCDTVVNILAPTRVTVSLVNNGDFTVDAQLFIAEDQEIVESLLTEIGAELNYSIAPGQTVTFSRDCEELQAIILDNAALQVIGSIGPEASSDVLRDGENFGCGDTITFTFDHSEILVDFEVTVAFTNR